MNGTARYIELKNANGRLGPAQKKVQGLIRANGIEVANCHSARDAIDTLMRWGVIGIDRAGMQWHERTQAP